jgi:hypothetical protein
MDHSHDCDLTTISGVSVPIHTCSGNAPQIFKVDAPQIIYPNALVKIKIPGYAKHQSSENYREPEFFQKRGEGIRNMAVTANINST